VSGPIKRVSATELRQNITAFVARAERGEVVIIITRRGNDVAALIPVAMLGLRA
jgi:prevent-host-death family protein